MPSDAFFRFNNDRKMGSDLNIQQLLRPPTLFLQGSLSFKSCFITFHSHRYRGVFFHASHGRQILELYTTYFSSQIQDEITACVSVEIPKLVPLLPPHVFHAPDHRFQVRPLLPQSPRSALLPLIPG